MGGSRDSGKRITSKRKGGGGKKTNGGDGLGASLAKAAEKNAHASNVKGQRPGGNINYATRTTNTNTNTKTTEKGGMVSVLERDDLTEMMAMAALSNRAFEAERVRYGGPVVVSLNHANNLQNNPSHINSSNVSLPQMASIQEIVPNSFRSQIPNDYRQPLSYLNS